MGGVCAALSVPRVPSGLLWQLRPSDVEVELLAHTRNVVSKDLEEETGLHTGWIQNGGLFIASNKQRLDEYKRLMSVRTRTDPRVLRGRGHSPLTSLESCLFQFGGSSQDKRK